MPTEVIGALEPLLGVTPSRLSEDVKSMLGCAKNHDDEAAFWKKYEAFDGGEPFEFQFETKDGLWLFLTAEQSRDKTTNLLIFRNITEEHKREEQYKRCLDDAEKASQFKTSFLFRMSHEIRTPMNGIIGMTEVALRPDQTEDKKVECLKKIDSASGYLLSNAAKYSNAGGHITLTVCESRVDDSYSDMYFEVKDNGIGIPEDKQQLIFQRFEQADDSANARKQGTGLGLERVDQVDIVEKRTGEKADFTGRRVLAVEDNELNMEIIRAILEERGMTS